MVRITVKPDLRKQELATLLAGRNTRRFSRSTAMRIDRLEDRFTGLIRPSLYYRQGKIRSISKGVVHLEEGEAFKSPKISRSMHHCTEVICFLATIGDGVDVEIKRLEGQNRLSDAYVLDAMGSVAVESIVDKFQHRMKERYQAKGRDVSLRFSPGYCDWPLTDQKRLFHFFNGLQSEVRLTDSCLMQPRKSVSGIFGILPAQMPSPVRPYNPCSDCSRNTCIARRR